MVSAAGAGAFARSGELAGRIKSSCDAGRGVPSAFMGESEPERRLRRRRFAPKRPFGTGSGSGGESLGSSLSERFSLAAKGGVLRLGHDGARKVSIARYI